MKILFMCVANSARSQMAEGLAKQIFGKNAWVESAGSEPKFVNPLATEAMKELGVDLGSHHSKRYEQLPREFTDGLDYIITLCAEEVCPTIANRNAKKLHWPFQDPAGQPGSHEDQLEKFRIARNLIQKRIEEFAKELSLGR